jgi:hypothetical protein
LPQVAGDVGEEASPREMEISSRDLAGAYQAGEDRVQLNNAEFGEEVASGGLGEKGIDPGGPYLEAVMFSGGTGIKEAVGHPGFLGSAFRAFGIHCLGKSGRSLGERLPHSFEAYAGVSILQPVVVSAALDSQGVMLMLAELSGQGHHGPENAAFVDNFDLFAHGRSSQSNVIRHSPGRRERLRRGRWQ